MYHWLAIFVMGWFGSVWWPGIEVDAPRPGTGPSPEPWIRLALGVVGGLAAILMARLAPESADALSGMVLSIAAGRVGSAIVAPAFGLLRR